MSEAPDSLILRHLRKMDEKLDRLSTDIRYMSASAERSLRHVATTERHCTWLDQSLDRVEARLDRIEKRLDLQETPR